MRTTTTAIIRNCDASSEKSNVEAALLSKIAFGDESALAQLYDTYSTVVYSVGLRVVRDPGVAVEVMQAVFLEVWNHPGNVSLGRAGLGCWLALTARNHAVDVVRRRSPLEKSHIVSDTPGFDAENGKRRAELLERVTEISSKLPTVQRMTLEMAFWGGCTPEEVAERTGLPLDIVTSSISSALATLGIAFA